MDAKEYYQQLLKQKNEELEEYKLTCNKIWWKHEFYKQIKPYVDKIINETLKAEYNKKIETNDKQCKIIGSNNDERKEILLKEIAMLETLI